MASSSVRIIAGQLKGRKVPTLPGKDIRPTSLRAREALFSILGTQIRQACLGDFFAGTGAVGIEALSRGADRVLFVEQSPAAAATIQQTLTQFHLSSQNRVLIEDVALAIQNPILLRWQPFDVLFIDPPYRLEHSQAILNKIEKADCVAPNGQVIYEHCSKVIPPSSIGCWTLTRTARYGDTALTFYHPQTHSTSISKR
ncbi:MAG: 16S rRNA (guanine(966)-N(2))-methyltransferase RsmD [Nitrospirales bacterium]